VDKLYALILDALTILNGYTESLKLSISGVRGLKPGERRFLIYALNKGKSRRIDKEIENLLQSNKRSLKFLINVKYSYQGEDNRRHFLRGDYFLLEVEQHNKFIGLKVQHLKGLLRTTEEYILEKLIRIVRSRYLQAV